MQLQCAHSRVEQCRKWKESAASTLALTTLKCKKEKKVATLLFNNYRSGASPPAVVDTVDLDNLALVVR